MVSGILEIHLVDARELQRTDLFGGMNPYVVFEYKGQQRESRVSNGCSPTWDQRIQMRAEYPGADNQYKLLLKIMDKDTFSRDDFVGETSIYLKDVLELGVEQGKAEIPITKYRIALSNGTYRGEIQVGVSFSSKRLEERNSPNFGGWRQSSLN